MRLAQIEILRAALALIGVASACGCSGSPADCVTNSDCPEQTICVGGACRVDPVDADVGADDARGACPPTESCDGVDNTCDGRADEGCDDDGDGFCDIAMEVLDGAQCRPGDCDDVVRSVNPGASEVCDGIDNNCIDGVDEGSALGAPTWYVDRDGDGFGDDASPTSRACARPDARAAEGGDCDDTDPAVHPDAVELCDGFDNNCDGAVDDSTAADMTDYYPDEDADTYGAETAVPSCGPLLGHVLRDGDCDDGDPDVNPGATEICSDGVDNDCDGTANHCALQGEITEAPYLSYTGDVDAVAVCDLNGDEVDDMVVGAWTLSPTHAGSVRVFYGPMDPGSVLSDAESDADITSDAFLIGNSLDCGRDATGDGTPDLLIGGPRLGSGESIVALFNGADLAAGLDVLDADWLITDTSGTTFGHDVRLVSHLNEDAVADVLFGSWQNTLYGALGPLSGAHAPEAISRLEGLSDYFGVAISVSGDVDGDGIDDVLVGDKGSAAGLGGGAHWFVGAASFPFALGDAMTFILDDSGIAGAENTILAAGDLTGNGSPDLVITAPWARIADAEHGRVFLVESPTQSAPLDASNELFAGARTSDTLRGSHVATGDVDGDGKADLLVAALAEDKPTFYVARGPVTHTDGIDAVFLSGATASVKGLATGRFNDDELDDIVLATRDGVMIWLGSGL